MYRGWWIIGALIGVALLIGASAFAYRAITHDWDDREQRIIQVTSPSGDGTTTPVEIVRVVDDGWGHRGGFFPGFFLFPLFFFGLIFLLFWAFGRGRWGGPRNGGPAWFEDWHRRQHENERQTPSQGASA